MPQGGVSRSNVAAVGKTPHSFRKLLENRAKFISTHIKHALYTTKGHVTGLFGEILVVFFFFFFWMPVFICVNVVLSLRPQKPAVTSESVYVLKQLHLEYHVLTLMYYETVIMLWK